MLKSFITLCALCATTLLTAQAGIWKTLDEDGQAKSHVELSINSEGVLSGKIVKLLQKPETTLCDKCSGALYNKPVMQMVIVQNMRLKDGYYQGGTILDPNNGKSYKCKLWLAGTDTLELRGSIGPFYRTQKWTRVQ